MKPGKQHPGGVVRVLATSAVIFFGCVGAPAAHAQEFREDLSHWCQDPWMLTAEGVVECLLADYRKADAELNRVYQQIITSLPPARREAVRASQRGWLVRYDSVLTSYYSKPWARHRRSEVLPSQIRAVRDRTAYLRRFATRR